MKTLNTYTPNELKNIARRNYHSILKLLNDAGIKPLMQHQRGSRIHSYYGADALDLVTKLRAEEDAKKADKQARKEAWAAKRAAAAERRAMKAAKKEKKETPIEVIQSVQSEYPTPVAGPSLRELVMETNRLLQEMLDFWKK